MARNGWNPSSWFSDIFFREEGGNYVYSLTDPLLGTIGGNGNNYSESRMMQLFESVAEFYFPVNGVAKRVQNGEYLLVNKDNEEVTDNALWNQWVNEGPNWKTKFEEFKWTAVVHQLVTGNRYGFQYCPGMVDFANGGLGTERLLKVKHKNIAAVHLLPPHYVFPMPLNPRPSYLTVTDAMQYINYFHYTGGDLLGQITPQFIVHEMINFMGDMADIVQWKGRSPFRAALKNLDNLQAVYEARNKNYRDGGPRGMWVNKTSDAGGNAPLSPIARKEVEQDMMKGYGIGRGQNMFGFTNQPLQFFKTGSNIAELEPFKETEQDAATLAGIMQFPMALLPGVQSKFSNLDIAERNVYENVIFSEADSLCNFFTKLGKFDELGFKVKVNFDNVTCLQDDALKFAQAFEANAMTALAMYQAKIITLNQLLEHIGKEAIEGGDVYESDINQETENIDLSTLPEETEKAIKKAMARLKKFPSILWGKKSKMKKKSAIVSHTS